MSLSHRLDFRRAVGIGAIGFALVATSTVARAGLLFEHHQGGPAEYRTVGVNHAGEFEVTEAIRIQAVSGWFTAGPGFFGYNPDTGDYDGPPGRVAVFLSEMPLGSPLSQYSPSGPVDLFTTFQLNALPPTPPGQLVPAGRWAGVGSLHWDLAPGTYSLNFFGANMPLAYGYFGPVHDVPDFSGFFYNFRADDPAWGGYPFGMRIYGRELSAVPESAAYGVVASVLLALTAMGWRARKLRDEVD